MIHPKFTKTFSMGDIGKSSTHKKTWKIGKPVAKFSQYSNQKVIFQTYLTLKCDAVNG